MISSADEFMRLCTSDKREDYVRATHDEAPEEIWLEVINRYPEMKPWVAHNKTIPLNVIRILSRDDDPAIRTFIAMKRRCPHDILGELSRDPDESVRNAVALNKKTPREILERLAMDEWEVCASNARANLESRMQ